MLFSDKINLKSITDTNADLSLCFCFDKAMHLTIYQVPIALAKSKH
jgi:hypothetical protein